MGITILGEKEINRIMKNLNEDFGKTKIFNFDFWKFLLGSGVIILIFILLQIIS